MDQGPLVGEMIEDGRRLIEQFAVDGNPVSAAFWLKEDEETPWYLHIATAVAETSGPRAAYEAIHASQRKLESPWFQNLPIRAVEPTQPVVQAVIQLTAQATGRAPIRYNGYRLGNLTVEQAYIYPPYLFTLTQPNPMTSDEVGREILKLMNRGPNVRLPSRVTLKDGTNFDGVPFSLQFGSQNALVVQFIADREPAPRVMRLDEIASIA